MSNRLFTAPYFMAIDFTGAPIVNARLTFYGSDTNQLLDTFSDPELTIPNDNPLAPTDGPLFGAIWLQPALYRVVLTGNDGEEIWTINNYGGVDTDTIYAPSFEFIGNSSPFANDILGLHVHIDNVLYPQGFFGSYGTALSPPVAPYTATVYRNDAPVGTFIINTAGQFGFATLNNETVTYQAGDVMKIVGANTPDGALQNFCFTFAGTLI